MENKVEDELQLDWSDEDSDASETSEIPEEISQEISKPESSKLEVSEIPTEDDACKFLTSKALDCYFLQTFAFKKNMTTFENVENIIEHLRQNVEGRV